MMQNSRILVLNSSDKENDIVLNLDRTIFKQDFDLEYDFKNDEFDMIILIFRSVNDLDVITYFRNKPEFDFIPIVCLVDKEYKALNIEIYRRGCDECFIRPINALELKVKIDSILKRYKEIYKSSISTLLPHLMKNNPNLKLTGREKDLLCLVAKGLTNAEISKILYLSEMTVKTHLKNIFKKLNVSNRTEAVFIGIINDLIEN